MILSVTLNAAIDVSYAVDHLSDGEPVRVRQVWRRAGGKGINAAYVLAAVGTEVTVTGLAGGSNGRLLHAALRETRLVDALFPVAGESRQTVVAVTADGRFAEYDEPGPEISAREWSGFLQHYRDCLPRCDFVLCAGSLPVGVPEDAYAQLTRIAHDHRRPVLVDSSGPALRNALEAPPEIVKINGAELGTLASAPLRSADDVLGAARDMHTRGVPAVVVTLGKHGVLAVGDGWQRRIRPPERAGSPVGAGDALTAGLLADRVRAAPVQDRLRFAAALAASTVGTAHAGAADLELALRLEPLTAVDAA